MGRFRHLEQLVEVLTFESGLERSDLVAYATVLYDPYRAIHYRKGIIGKRQHLNRDISRSRGHG